MKNDMMQHKMEELIKWMCCHNTRKNLVRKDEACFITIYWGSKPLAITKKLHVLNSTSSTSSTKIWEKYVG